MKDDDERYGIMRCHSSRNVERYMYTFAREEVGSTRVYLKRKEW